MTTIIQQAERDFEDARREYIKAQVAQRASRAKVEAAAKRLAHLQFLAVEADMDIERARKEGELRR